MSPARAAVVLTAADVCWYSRSGAAKEGGRVFLPGNARSPGRLSARYRSHRGSPMSVFRNAGLVLLFLVLLAHLTGCTGARTMSSEMGREVPGWVRVVLPEHEGRTLFVGGVAFATDPETGIEGAAADAGSQIYLSATQAFTELFNRGIQKSGVETTPVERLHFKNAVIAVYGDRMAATARQDSVYYRPCGDEAGAEGLAGAGSTSPVCQIFVLMSVDAGEWHRGLGEVLAKEKRRRTEEGEGNLADLAEWLIRQTLEEEPAAARERSR